MILDDLFNQAATDFAKLEKKFSGEAFNNPSVEVAYTLSQTGGLASSSNKVSCNSTAIKLSYIPSKKASGRTVSAEFQSAPGASQITITAPNASISPPIGYLVEMLGSSFTPQVLPLTQTNVIFGEGGTTFVTICLCGYLPGGGPPE